MVGSTPYDMGGDRGAEDQLDLAEDDSLPWLEAAEDDDHAAGFDISRLILLGVLALVLLGAVVGSIWFLTNQASDEPEPDGSVIAAPEEPYKTGPTIASTVNEGTRATPVAGTSVQVGAYPRRADAEAAWSNLMRQTEALNGVSHRVVEAQVDIGTVYRLQAITGDRASASRLCAALKADGLACFVK